MADVVHIVRHAAPPLEKQRRYWGASDPGLAPGALDSVRKLAGIVTPRPGILLASPLPRAAATAARLGQALGLGPETVPELAEISFGLFEGLTYAEAEVIHPGAAAQWAEQGDGFAFPGGESIGAFLDRAGRAFTLCTERPEDTVLCVTHGGVIAAWCCLFLGLPPGERFAFRPDYAALTTFRRGKNGSGWEKVFFNRT